jgi:hypothetical protein
VTPARSHILALKADLRKVEAYRDYLPRENDAAWNYFEDMLSEATERHRKA